MISSTYLTIILCMILVYAMLGVITSTLVEQWINWKNKRGIFLKESILNLLNDEKNPAIVNQFYSHPVISKLFTQKEKLPSYISSENFSNALIDIVAGFSPNSADVNIMLAERFEQGTNALNDSPLKKLLRNLCDNAKTTVQITLPELQKQISKWFDDYQDRVSGQFKRRAKRWTMIAGLIVTLVLNVDSIHLLKSFYLDNTLRDAVALQAERIVQNPSAFSVPTATSQPIPYDKIIEQFQKTSADLSSWGIPIGWNDKNLPKRDDYGFYILGLLTTAFALAFGGPFWFDLLVKFINIRSAGPKPPKAEDKKDDTPFR